MVDFSSIIQNYLDGKIKVWENPNTNADKAAIEWFLNNTELSKADIIFILKRINRDTLNAMMNLPQFMINNYTIPLIVLESYLLGFIGGYEFRIKEETNE